MLLCGCSANQEAFRGCYYLGKAAQRSLPVNELYIINVDTKEGSRLDVYFQIPYSRIHFEKDQDLFSASYSVSFVLRDGSGAVVSTKDFDRKVIASSYGESHSSRRDGFLEMFRVPPGQYDLTTTVTDNDSKLQYRRRLSVEIKAFSQKYFSVSDYLLFERALSEKGIISLSPVFPADISFTTDSIGMFQELYHVQKGDTIRLVASYSVPNTVEKKEAVALSLSPPYSRTMADCISTGDSTYFRRDSSFVPLDTGTFQVFQYFPKPAKGLTTLTRMVLLTRDGVTDSNVTTQRIPVYDRTFPRLDGIGEEVEAISYIAWPNEYDSIRTAPTLAEQSVRLAKFWGDHGGTARRTEFLNRIAEANELFSSCMEGWKTPMGIVYIICGPPDYVECQGGIDERWYYDLGGNRALVIPFRQSYQVSSYRYFELIPFSLSDLVWQQFVEKWRNY